MKGYINIMKKFLGYLFILGMATTSLFAEVRLPDTIRDVRGYKVPASNIYYDVATDSYTFVDPNTPTDVSGSTVAVNILGQPIDVNASVVFPSTTNVRIIDQPISVNSTLQNSSIDINDLRFKGKTADGISGQTITTGVIAIPGSLVSYSFYSKGGEADISLSYKAGSILLPEGVGHSKDLIVPISGQSIIINSLDSGTTLYYDIDSIQ